jgi:hypothetical protein
LWIDTGSPNTLVHSDFAKRFKLPLGGGRYKGYVAGKKFQNRPTVTIPEITIPGCHPLRNVKAIAALDGDEWENIVVIGLNVLNHLTYRINRDPMPGTFEWIESLSSTVIGSTRTRFDHVIMDGKYVLADFGIGVTELSNPMQMTKEEANEKFYPNAYAMVNCEIYGTQIVSGDVIAYAPAKELEFLVDYADELAESDKFSNKFGIVIVCNTKDPSNDEMPTDWHFLYD